MCLLLAPSSLSPFPAQFVSTLCKLGEDFMLTCNSARWASPSRRSVRTILLAKAALAVLLSAGCRSDRDALPTLSRNPAITLHDAAARPAPPAFQTVAPGYPAAVQYIVYREYLHRNPRVTALTPDDKHYQQYVERRLRQLYPTRGYEGMMGEAVADVRRYHDEWKEYRRQA